MSTNAYRLPALQPYPIVRLLPFWGRCWCTGPDGSRCAGAIIEHGNAHEDFVDTICAYIENWLFGFCWAFQSFRKRCYQHQNRTTGAALLHNIPQNDTSSALEQQSLEKLRSGPYGSDTPIPKPYGRNLSKPNIAPVI